MINHLLKDKAQFLTENKNSGWNGEVEWVIDREVPCLIRLLTGGQTFTGGASKLITTHRAYTDERPTYQQRLQNDGNVYRIVLVDKPIGADWFQVDLEFLPDEPLVEEV